MDEIIERVDRPAAIRRALCALVAEKGFHGASMSAVAASAGVATGTAYVHYASKDELVLATYLEVKRDLGEAAVAAADPDASPAGRFVELWAAVYRHLSANRDRARFLVQVESSPYAQIAHGKALEVPDDPLLMVARRPEMAAQLAPFPTEVLYELAIGPAVRMAAAGIELTGEQIEEVARACWRAVAVAQSPGSP